MYYNIRDSRVLLREMIVVNELLSNHPLSLSQCEIKSEPSTVRPSEVHDMYPTSIFFPDGTQHPRRRALQAPEMFLKPIRGIRYGNSASK